MSKSQRPDPEVQLKPITSASELQESRATGNGNESSLVVDITWLRGLRKLEKYALYTVLDIYNCQHYHSGLNLMTPLSVHYGQAGCDRFNEISL